MRRRTLTLAAAGTAAILGASAMTEPAAARAYCDYVATDANGKVVARGHGSAVTMKRACIRAERRCKRNLKHRPFRGCHKIGQAK